ncbi:Asp-tRNA(Asn)/Glu-tRNA(Gln) amidotransferase subunit GatB [Candidatus Microgenomates bacterium]|nr:MAG: Asp-tRNA(Asn)/Glu-tRNA(Gln) amidotransferase subunit GatB [Candidatus Microgenomates bacterium]
MNKYEPVIGLEIHVELKTKSKMFCRCSTDYFGKKPNTQTCPICLGLPGALPYANKAAIEDCIKIGLALNCTVSELSLFERKNYFYPDLPKGYQISQYRWPLCVKGWVEIKDENNNKTKIRINRVHQEEDTGKLVHLENETLVDYNRSSVPLAEIVTEPDFRSSSQVKNYSQKLQQIFRYLEVSDADMERGDMRLEANVSVRPIGQKELPNYRVELKNINSFRFITDAIEYEIKRQVDALEKGEELAQETRGWNELKSITFSQRKKEEAHDYRYFPDPDLPQIEINESEIKAIKAKMPELPDIKFERFKKEYGLSDYDTEILTREKSMAEYFEEIIQINQELKNRNEKFVETKVIANWIINKKPDINQVLPAELLKTILSATQTVGIDEKELEKIIKKVLDENQKAVEDYKSGKENVIMFLIGQVMRNVKMKIDIQIVKKALIENIK